MRSEATHPIGMTGELVPQIAEAIDPTTEQYKNIIALRFVFILLSKIFLTLSIQTEIAELHNSHSTQHKTNKVTQ